jgi:hypothetical protein
MVFTDHSYGLRRCAKVGSVEEPAKILVEILESIRFVN